MIGHLQIAAMLCQSISIGAAGQAVPPDPGTHRGTLYRLSVGSLYQDGCFDPCDCPLFETDAIRGTFRVQRRPGGKDVQVFAIRHIDWVVPISGDEAIHVHGRGRYELMDDAAGSYRLRLQLRLNNQPPELFDSGVMEGAAPSPRIEAMVSLSGLVCDDTAFTINAGPVMPPDGACCLANGECIEVSARACEEEGGQIHHAGTSCEAVDCHPNGNLHACCLPKGQCEALEMDVCIREGGQPQMARDCASTTCEGGGLHACCLPNGACFELMPDHCRDEGGMPSDARHCGPQACGQPAIGACCHVLLGGLEACIVLTRGECVDLNGQFQGAGTECDDTIDCGQIEPTACCLPNGECLELFPRECQLEGGMPSDAPHCGPQVCGGPVIGACCHVNVDGAEACIVLSRGECVELHGDFQGAGTECDDAVGCGQVEPTACCLPNGECLELRPRHCLDEGGMPNDARHCDPQVCDGPRIVGCCFADGGCAELPLMHCLMEGGQPLPPGVPCHDGACGDPTTGACCFHTPGMPNVCEELPEIGCLHIGGDYLGDGVLCDPDIPCGPPPPTVPCCLPDGACVELIMKICLHEGGEPLPPDVTCQNGVCGKPIIGACCLVNAAGVADCIVLSRGECVEIHGDFQGAGTECNDTIDCGQVEPAACCLPNGECLELMPNHCWEEGGMPSDARHCGPDVCHDDPIVGCCLPEGGCVEAPLRACLNEGGQPLPPGMMCHEGACGDPVIGACCFADASGSFECAELSQRECHRWGGDFQGVNTECNANTDCSMPDLVACCLPNGECMELRFQHCIDEGGNPRDAPHCGPGVCWEGPMVGCCLPEGGCAELPLKVCWREGGGPLPPGVTCQEGACAEPGVGACCLDMLGAPIDCLELPGDLCHDLGGNYLGDGSVCDPAVPCGQPELTACCIAGEGCFELLPEHCILEGGEPLNVPHCAPDVCFDDPIVGCCLPNSDCVEAPLRACLEEGGEPLPSGVACHDGACGDTAIGACCLNPTGGHRDCMMLSASDCDASGGDYQGDGTPCDPNTGCGLAPGTPTNDLAVEVTEFVRKLLRFVADEALIRQES